MKANISLSDWAGSPEIFEECNEVVTYLRYDTNYKLAESIQFWIWLVREKRGISIQFEIV